MVEALLTQTREDQEYSACEELLQYSYTQRANAFWSGCALGFLAGVLCGFLLVLII